MPHITVQNYHEAARALAGGRSKTDRPVGNNTRLQRRSETSIALRYHYTDIVVYHLDERVELNSGGWRTYTTKERLNIYTPVMVYQTDGEWYVRSGPWGDDSASTIVFADGMVWHPDGTITGGLDITEATRKQDHARKVKRDVRRYIDAITPEQIIQLWEGGTTGDCLFCQLTSNPANDGQDLGGDHLELHLEEGYFMASLAYTAIRAQGYRDPSVIMWMIYHDAQRGRVSTDLTQALSKYLKKHLIKGLATR